MGDEPTLLEIIFSNKTVLVLCAALALAGCGRQWEHLWGQDTKPETKYIPMNPGCVDFPIGSLNPVQWADRRFQDARFKSVWACTAADVCAQMPILGQDPSSPDCYVTSNGALISAYNVQLVYPAAVKIRVQIVM